MMVGLVMEVFDSTRERDNKPTKYDAAHPCHCGPLPIPKLMSVGRNYDVMANGHSENGRHC